MKQISTSTRFIGDQVLQKFSTPRAREGFKRALHLHVLVPLVEKSVSQPVKLQVNGWYHVVSYSNNEQASITLTGPGEVRFTFIQTETCCDKLIFFHDTPPVIISGYSLDRLPEVISLADGVHSVEWSSDYSVTTSGWSFTYKYLGTTSSTPGLLAVIPKPSGSQDLAYLIENQQPPGSHFIVKTAYDSTESDAILAIPIGDFVSSRSFCGTGYFHRHQQCCWNDWWKCNHRSLLLRHHWLQHLLGKGQFQPYFTRKSRSFGGVLLLV